jgi:hypothetical protein
MPDPWWGHQRWNRDGANERQSRSEAVVSEIRRTSPRPDVGPPQVDPRDDPEALIRELERSLNEQARASEVATGQLRRPTDTPAGKLRHPVNTDPRRSVKTIPRHTAENDCGLSRVVDRGRDRRRRGASRSGHRGRRRTSVFFRRLVFFGRLDLRLAW